mmetsp:Transcript_34224/g.89798  ORF Transcript_34224/g.89798 Transcript_34224/m.89798 type:complete len:232 (-) Transcript_34224:2662-3357(-)
MISNGSYGTEYPRTFYHWWILRASLGNLRPHLSKLDFHQQRCCRALVMHSKWSVLLKPRGAGSRSRLRKILLLQRSYAKHSSISAAQSNRANTIITYILLLWRYEWLATCTYMKRCDTNVPGKGRYFVIRSSMREDTNLSNCTANLSGMINGTQPYSAGKSLLTSAASSRVVVCITSLSAGRERTLEAPHSRTLLLTKIEIVCLQFVDDPFDFVALNFATCALAEEWKEAL